MHPLASLRSVSVIALAALLAVACGGSSNDAAAKEGSAGRPAAAQKAGAPAGAPGAPGGAPGGAAAGGQRRSAAVVLGVADVAKVARGFIEAGIPIAGDLRPIETLSLKSRLEGNIEQVFVREGDRVSLGTPLARFEAVDFESALRSAEADVISQRTAATTAQWNYDQSKDLFKVGAIAERDLRATEQSAAAAKAQQAAAESRLRTAQSQSRDTRIVAPVAGTIQFRRVQGGEHVLRGAEMFTLVRNDVLELTAALPARRANEVLPGQPVRFLADGRAFAGKVARVSPTIDPASRSITAYVQIPNPKGELKGNTFSTGQIIAATLSNVLVIPQPAVRTGQDGKQFAYRITDGELEQVPIAVGAVDEARGLVEIKDGLKERDQVVVGNVGTLGRGMKAQIIGNERGSGPGGARGGDARTGGSPAGGAPAGDSAAAGRRRRGPSGSGADSSAAPATGTEQKGRGGRKPGR